MPIRKWNGPLSLLPAFRRGDYIGKLVLPELKTCSLPHEYGRVPDQLPATPLGH